MSDQVKIGVVEDEAMIAESIRSALKSLGYDVPPPAMNYDQAIAMLQKEQPDLALLDVKLRRSKDGIEVARYIRDNMNIPIIFLTANSDTETVQRAKEVKPNAFLVKPFQKADLYTSIEIAINSFSGEDEMPAAAPAAKPGPVGDIIFIKEGYYFHKVRVEDITHLSSEHVYVTVHTPKKNFLIRASLQSYLEKFDPTKFIRVHQRYAVNILKIDKINTLNLYIGNEEIPISKPYYQPLMDSLNLG